MKIGIVAADIHGNFKACLERLKNLHEIHRIKVHRKSPARKRSIPVARIQTACG